MAALSCICNNDLNKLCNVCKLSQQKKCDLEELDEYGNTALLKACYLGRFEALQLLLKYGANYKAINYFGQNALTLATYSGCESAVIALLKYRSLADFNMSSVVPAYCVATLMQHTNLMALLWSLDQRSCAAATTSHGSTTSCGRFIVWIIITLHIFCH